MPRRRFRDRFYTPPVAKAVTSPFSILLAGVAAAVAIVATAPLSLPLGAVAGLVAGGAAYGGRVLLAVPRDERGPRMDPFAVQEPWRRFAADAIAARHRFDEAVRAMDGGPLRERLAEIAGRLDDGVEEIWAIAQQGDRLVAARRNVDVDGARRELAEIESQPAESWAPGSRLGQTADALRAQVASGVRMETVIEDAVTRLRLLDARLDETVTRAIELSTGLGPARNAGQVGGDVEGIVGEMEALRLALDEASVAGAGLPTTALGNIEPDGGTQASPSP